MPPRLNFIAQNKKLSFKKTITSDLIKQRIEQASLKRKIHEELNFKKHSLQQVKWDLVRVKRRQMESLRDFKVKRVVAVRHMIRIVAEFIKIKRYFFHIKSLIYRRHHVFEVMMMVGRLKYRLKRRVLQFGATMDLRYRLTNRNNFLLRSTFALNLL